MLHPPLLLGSNYPVELGNLEQVFGDLSWVPFTYSLQARYLSDHPQVSMPAL